MVRSIGVAILLMPCSCMPARHAPVPPPAYPWAGLGRLGCFAGPGLARGFRGDPVPGGDAAIRGPWLVLDSLSAEELRRAGHAGQIHSSALRPATLLARGDSVEWTGGHWTRVGNDSIVVRESSTFPSVTWRFHVEASGMRGEGVLEHDVISRGPDGAERRRVSRWAVQLATVPCADVPIRGMH